MKLLLFDIDGTILLTNGAGTRAANRAFEKIYGHTDAMAGIDAAGKTDPLILREMFGNMLSRDYTEDEAEEFYGEYVVFLEEEVEKSPIDIMPGIPKLIEKLSSREDLVLGIATGNIERGALIKLRRAGIDRHFPVGGFGSDSGSREALIRVAVERAKVRLEDSDKIENIYVIGDTPHDIIHGRAAGAVTVAVATGRYSSGELREHDPDYLFEHLGDFDQVMAVFD
ncbi:MAG: HAD hydrolase-like protein [Thermodesulfobacteriota bacterium]